MKSYEILELPTRDTETRSEQMLLGKWGCETCLTQDCHRPSTGTQHSICKAQ